MGVTDRVLEWGVNLFLDHIDTSEIRLVGDDIYTSNDTVPTMPQRDRDTIRITFKGVVFVCEDCGNDEFYRDMRYVVICTNCESRWSIDYARVDIERLA